MTFLGDIAEMMVYLGTRSYVHWLFALIMTVGIIYIIGIVLRGERTN